MSKNKSDSSWRRLNRQLANNLKYLMSARSLLRDLTPTTASANPNDFRLAIQPALRIRLTVRTVQLCPCSLIQRYFKRCGRCGKRRKGGRLAMADCGFWGEGGGFGGDKKQHNCGVAEVVCFDSRHDVVDIIQQISLIKQRSFPLMSSPPPSPLPASRKKTLQNALGFAKRSHLPRKQPSFSRHSSLPADLSESSDFSGGGRAVEEGKSRWSGEEDRQLISLFGRLGADWQQVAVLLANRTPSEIKHHFAKILRKVIQNLNQQQRQRGQAEISKSRIRQALEVAGQQSEESLGKEDPATIRDEIYKLAQESLVREESGGRTQMMLESARSILLALKRIRRKRHSNSKASTDIYFKSELESEQMERGYASDSSSVFEECGEGQSQLRNHDACFADEQGLSESDQQSQKEKGVIVEESEEGIKDLLRESGLLEVEEYPASSKNMTINCQESIASSSQNPNNESYQHFYEESELERDCYWKKSCSDLKSID